MSALSSDTEMGRSVEDLFHCTFHALSTIEWSHYVKSWSVYTKFLNIYANNISVLH